MQEDTVITFDVATLAAEDRAPGFYVVVGPFADSEDAVAYRSALTLLIDDYRAARAAA